MDPKDCDLDPGDRVIMNCFGSPIMTVERVDCCRLEGTEEECFMVSVIWWMDGQPYRDQFRVECLSLLCKVPVREEEES